MLLLLLRAIQEVLLGKGERAVGAVRRGSRGDAANAGATARVVVVVLLGALVVGIAIASIAAVAVADGVRSEARVVRVREGGPTIGVIRWGSRAVQLGILLWLGRKAVGVAARGAMVLLVVGALLLGRCRYSGDKSVLLERGITHEHRHLLLLLVLLLRDATTELLLLVGAAGSNSEGPAAAGGTVGGGRAAATAALLLLLLLLASIVGNSTIGVGVGGGAAVGAGARLLRPCGGEHRRSDGGNREVRVGTQWRGVGSIRTHSAEPPAVGAGVVAAVVDGGGGPINGGPVGVAAWRIICSILNAHSGGNLLHLHRRELLLLLHSGRGGAGSGTTPTARRLTKHRVNLKRGQEMLEIVCGVCASICGIGRHRG